jgi:hypothetical protein
MKYIALFAIVFFAAVPAIAQTVSVTTLCSQLVAHTPGEDVEFKPGVDAQGNPITPADINAPIEAIAYPIQIPIEIDIVKLLDLELPPGIESSTEMNAAVAFLSVEKDGRVFYNGQDVSDRVTYTCKDDLDAVAPAAAPAAQPAPAATPAQAPAQAEPAPASAPTPESTPSNEQAQ